jgi:hypothetical protein
VNLLVKCAEISSPREALSAISSAGTGALDILGIVLLLLLGRFPSGDQMVVFAVRITPDFENHGTEARPTPADGTELCRVFVLPVNDIRLVEDLLGLFQTYAVSSLDIPALRFVELEARSYITVIPVRNRALRSGYCEWPDSPSI